MTRVTAPGLPSSPKILFDPKKLRAKVAMRHTTWRGTEKALYATELLTWIARLGLAVYLWQRYPHHGFGPRLLLIFVAVVILFPIVAAIVRGSFRHFMARQIFPSKTTLWVTPDAIAFRSGLYSNPVIISRAWNGVPIGIRFIVDRDQAAEQYNYSLDYKRKLPKDHLSQSSMLYLVLTTGNPTQAVNYGGHDSSMRSIPITEIDSNLATKATMAYAHSLTITTPRPGQADTQPDVGIDIDQV